MYIDKPDEITNKYNSTYHGTIEMKLVDFMSVTYIDFDVENNDKNFCLF